MLKELHDVRQIRGDYQRRIFSDLNCDLIIWLESDETIHGFCFSYELQSQARALTWTARKGFFHDRIDQGEESPLANRSPMLIRQVAPPPGVIAQRFQEVSGELPHAIRDFVRLKIIAGVS
jgi:hypothetical protein